MLVYEFVNGEAEHRERCAICSLGGRWCKPLIAALETITDWRRGRRLYNRAVALRAAQDIWEAKHAHS